MPDQMHPLSLTAEEVAAQERAVDDLAQQLLLRLPGHLEDQRWFEVPRRYFEPTRDPLTGFVPVSRVADRMLELVNDLTFAPVPAQIGLLILDQQMPEYATLLMRNESSRTASGDV